MSFLNDSKMDKAKLTIVAIRDPSAENEYQRGQTPEARLEALELMRQVIYSCEPSTKRLQRLFTVTQRESH